MPPMYSTHVDGTQPHCQTRPYAMSHNAEPSPAQNVAKQHISPTSTGNRPLYRSTGTGILFALPGAIRPIVVAHNRQYARPATLVTSDGFEGDGGTEAALRSVSRSGCVLLCDGRIRLFASVDGACVCFRLGFG
jgi:hypothetical protein